jgi:exopolyphosphatase/guanosine-5'-triphosphate,3'-diphosphate pyrophosphatase
VRIAAFDLGSNSFHLLVADAHPDGSFEVIATDQEMRLLGSAVASTGRIGVELAGAAVEVVKRFVDLAESNRAEEMVVCATSAFREASDSVRVVERIDAQCKVKVRVISGREEARLIFEAVRASVVIDPSPALAMDLGGGSLELMVGDGRGLAWAASLKLGVARLTAEHVRSDPPSHEDVRRVSDAVGRALGRVAGQIGPLRPKAAIFSSGTLETLVGLAAQRRDGRYPTSLNQLSVSAADLRKLRDDIVSMTAEERSSLPGVDSRRADLLPAGAVLASQTLAKFAIDEVIGCEWALREGMILDAIGRHNRSDWSCDPHAMRRESVINLARRYGWNEAHSCKVSRLAVELFDGTKPLHDLDGSDRELLEYGALLHDVGEHVSNDRHEQHSGYLIANGKLRGFRPEDVDVLACLGRFHKRGSPKASFEPYGRLSAPDRRRVSQMVALLQVADGLDRSHGGPVRDLAVSVDSRKVVVVVDADDDISLELWGLRRKRDLFEKVFARELEVIDPRYPSAAVR